jgi:hypothetical protein
VPVYYAPNVGPAAFRIVERFQSWKKNHITKGSCALIVLSLDDPLLPKLLSSFDNQLAKRNPKRKVPWSRAIPEREQHKQLFDELRINSTDGVWEHTNAGSTSRLAAGVARDVKRFCKLQGVADVPQELAGQFARLAVHNARAFGRNSPQFQVLTVHGAKNREFDHVFVFWAFKAGKWSTEEQRRLLYNAVTRAKLDCTVLVLGNEKGIQKDPVIRLLGSAQPAIDPAWSKKKSASTK